jgi:hypothetical protein
MGVAVNEFQAAPTPEALGLFERFLQHVPAGTSDRQFGCKTNVRNSAEFADDNPTQGSRLDRRPSP